MKQTARAIYNKRIRFIQTNGRRNFNGVQHIKQIIYTIYKKRSSDVQTIGRRNSKADFISTDDPE